MGKEYIRMKELLTFLVAFVVTTLIVALCLIVAGVIVTYVIMPSLNWLGVL
jgi:hypothetical protein